MPRSTDCLNRQPTELGQMTHGDTLDEPRRVAAASVTADDREVMQILGMLLIGGVIALLLRNAPAKPGLALAATILPPFGIMLSALFC
ncbi:MAG: hypothetical protein NXI31_06450 [bacterium]|nr:hypothetical protein [bacterium]